MLKDKNDLTTCSLSYVFSSIGGKWKPFIIWYLWNAPTGVRRYGELKRKIPWDISHKMFAQQLRELEEAKIVTRMEYDEKPLRVEYSLTEQGKLLAPAIQYLRDWGAEFGDGFTHGDMIERTQGHKKDGGLEYGYVSDGLNKGVKIRFDYLLPENAEQEGNTGSGE